MPEAAQGGFEYKISVLSDLESLKEFQQALRDLKTELEDASKSVKKSGDAARDASALRKKAAAIEKEIARASKEGAASEEIRAAALAKLSATLERNLVAEEAARIEKTKAFAQSRRASSQALREQKVIQDLVKVYEKQRRAQIALGQSKEFAAEQSLQFSAAELKAAGVLDQTTLQIAAARDRLAKTQISGQAQIIAIQAEAKALALINAELVKQAALRRSADILRRSPAQTLLQRTATGVTGPDPAEQARRESELAALREDIQKRSASQFAAFEKETTAAVQAENRKREIAFAASEQKRVSDLRVAIQQRAALRAQFEAEEVGRGAERARQAFEAEQAINRQQQLAIKQRLEEQASLRAQFDAQEVTRASERARASVEAEDAARAGQLQGIRARLEKEAQLRDAFNREEIQRASQRARAVEEAERLSRVGQQQLIKERLQEEERIREDAARRVSENERKRAEAVTRQSRRDRLRRTDDLLAPQIARRRAESEINRLRSQTANEDLLQQNALVEVERRRLQNAQNAVTQRKLQEAGLISRRQQIEATRKSISLTEKTVRQLFFTFRRLVGVLAVFTLARKVFQGFSNAIKTAVSFNAKLEQSKIAIGSLIVASGAITNAFGENVEGAEGLQLAISKARQQQELLRADALFTAATYEELVQAYQTAIAPGLQVGFDLDQIRKFTVQISQAATAIGLPQQQLAEEIRSLLQGTIRARDTRIAVSLGITNQDIKRAKELGQLAEFLDSRFRSFNDAAEAAQDTFALLASNTRDALVQLAAFAGKDFFTDLKGILSDIRGSVTEINEETGAIELDPQALTVLESFFGILEAGADQFRILLNSFSAEGLKSAGDSLKDTFTLVFATLRIAVQGILAGLGDILAVISVVDKAFLEFFSTIRRVFGDAFVDGLQKFLVIITRTVIGVGALNFALNALLKISVFGILKSAASGLATAFTGLQLIALNIGGAFRGIAKAASVAAIPLLKFTAIVAGLAALYLLAKNAKEAFFDGSQEERLVGEYKEIEVAIERLNLKLQDALSSGDADVPGAAEFELLEAQLEEAKKALDDFGIDPDTFVPPTVQQRLKETKDGFVNDVQTMIEKVGTLKDSLLGAADSAGDIALEFDTTVSTVISSNRALLDQSKLIDDIAEGIKASKLDLIATVETLGAGNAAYTLRANTVKAIVESEQKSKEINTAIRQEEVAILQAQQRRVSNAAQIAALEEKQKTAVISARRNTLAINEAKQVSAKLEKEIALEQAKVRSLGKGDSEERIAALKNIQTLNDKLIGQKKAITRLEERTSQLLSDAAVENGLNAEELNGLAREYLVIQAEIIARGGNIKDLENARATILSGFLARAAQDNLAVAIKDTFEISKQNRELAIQAQTQRQLAEIRQEAFVDPNKIAVVQAQEELALQRLRKQELVEENTVRQQSLDQSISENRFNVLGLALLAQKTAEQQRYTTELERQNAEIRQAQIGFEKLKLLDESPFFAGSLEAIRSFIQTSGSAFQQTFNVLQSGFQGFANTVGSTIASIFDPANTQSAKERWGRFLLSLVQQAISALVSIAIAQKILLPWLDAVAPAVAAGSGGTLGGSRFQKGGEIPASGVASPAHFVNPKGLATGGDVLKNIGSPPSQVDTVPIWAQQGEFMMRLSAVKKYGLDFMHSINSGLIDASTLRGMTSSRSFGRRQGSVPRRGYQTGGEIQQGLSRLASDRDSSGGSSSGVPPLGFMLASENQMEMMLRGGKNAFMRFLSENSSTIGRMLPR